MAAAAVDDDTPVEPCAPVAGLIKGLGTLQRIVTPLLSPRQLEDAASRITLMLSGQLPLHISALCAAADADAALGTRTAAAHSLTRASGRLRLAWELTRILLAVNRLPNCQVPRPVHARPKRASTSGKASATTDTGAATTAALPAPVPAFSSSLADLVAASNPPTAGQLAALSLRRWIERQFGVEGEAALRSLDVDLERH